MTVIEADAAPASSEIDADPVAREGASGGSDCPHPDGRGLARQPETPGLLGHQTSAAGHASREPGELDPTDLQLWAQSQAGVASAFGALYERHVDAVLNHCFRRTGSWALAEDLTSSVFLETWRRRDAVELTTGSLLPWLLGTANNVIRHQLRSLLRHRRALSRLPHGAVAPDHSDDAAERLDAEAHMRRVLSAVNRLTVVEREVVALCVWAGLSYADAAVAMGIPVGTVRSRLARARERLRRLAQEPAPGEVRP